MALFGALGYKHESPQRSNRNQLNAMQSNHKPQSQFNPQHNINSYPNSINTSNQMLRNRNRQNMSQQQSSANSMFGRNMNHNLNPSYPSSQNHTNTMFNNQENNNFLSNNSSSLHPTKSNSNSLLFGSSPNKNIHSNQQNRNNINNNSKSSKYASLPKKSIRSSGIGFVSPIPPKYQANGHHDGQNINKLDISHNNGSMTLNDHQQSMTISPIKPSVPINDFSNDHTLQLNTTSNTLDFSNMATTTIANPTQYANESRLSVQQMNQTENIHHKTQVAIIGFPAGEAQYIHRKFRSYGTILRSEWKDNTLFLQYEHPENATRALAETAKWINHGNSSYMIAVMYAESTEMNPLNETQNKDKGMSGNGNNNGGGRYLNFTQMYNNSFNNPDRNIPSYLHHNNIERPPAIQSGTKHIIWKIFNYLTSGW